MSETPMTVNEAFTALAEIRRRCPDIALKVVTVDDVYSTLGLDEIDYAPQVQEALRERIRRSWEFQNYDGLTDYEWEFFYAIDGIEETLRQFGEKTPGEIYAEVYTDEG